MVLTSALYLTFLVGILFLYYILPKKMQWLILTIASISFMVYSIQNPLVYLVIAYGILVTFIGGIAIENTIDDRKKDRRKVITIILVLAELIALKYLNFFEITINAVRGTDVQSEEVKAISMLAPLGVSFYTLISIGYVLDVARKTVRAQRNLIKYILFVLYFPQITSGPITRYSEMKEQLYTSHDFKFKNICFGFQRIIWGLFKKLVISERMAILVNTIFDNYTDYSGLYIIVRSSGVCIPIIY